jgi:hypothetical protein
LLLCQERAREGGKEEERGRETGREGGREEKREEEEERGGGDRRERERERERARADRNAETPEAAALDEGAQAGHGGRDHLPEGMEWGPFRSTY